jgi:hypothetical protein
VESEVSKEIEEVATVHVEIPVDHKQEKSVIEVSSDVEVI